MTIAADYGRKAAKQTSKKVNYEKIQQTYDEIIMQNFPACSVKEGKIQLLTETDLIQFAQLMLLYNCCPLIHKFRPSDKIHN